MKDVLSDASELKEVITAAFSQDILLETLDSRALELIKQTAPYLQPFGQSHLNLDFNMGPITSCSVLFAF